MNTDSQIRPRCLMAAILAAATLTSSGGCLPQSVAQAVGETSASGSVDRVNAAPVGRKSIQLYTTQPGRIVAFEETPLVSKLDGYVAEVLADIGDTVRKGSPLVRLSVPEMEVERQQKQALLAQSDAEIVQAQAAVRASQAALTTAEAQVAEAEAGTARATADYERWKSESERIQQLAERGSVTNKLAEETLNQLRAAEAARTEVGARVASAKAGRDQMQAAVEKAEADVVAAEARRRVAEANLAHTQTLLAYAEITAPFDGAITRRNVDTGHYVQPARSNGDPLMVVARTDKVRVIVEVPEMEAPLIDAGEAADTASVTIQSLAGRSYEATVTRASWALGAANRSLRAEIDLANSDQALRPGMYAIAQILLDQREDVLTLPTTAIIRGEGPAYCCVVKEGTVEHRPIELGLRSGSDVEIVSGLQEGEVVVMTGAGSLRDGQTVEVISPAT